MSDDHQPVVPHEQRQPIDPDVLAAPDRSRNRRPARPWRAADWSTLGLIALGGGIGSVARFGLARAIPTGTAEFPWATFVTNTAGCFALGLLMVFVLEVWPRSRYLRPFLGVGVLGGFTTFSTYTVEIRGMLAAHHFALATSYALASLVGGLTLTWLGIVVMRRAFRLPVRRGPRRRSAARQGAPTGSRDGDRDSLIGGQRP